MTLINQQVDRLDLSWWQGEAVDQQVVLVDKAGWAGAAHADTDNAVLAAGLTFTITADNQDALFRVQLTGVDSEQVSDGQYDWVLRRDSDNLALAVGRIVVLASTTLDDLPEPPTRNDWITAEEVFEWMGSKSVSDEMTITMTRVVKAVCSRIGRSWDAPTTLPDDDWSLALIMQSARIYKRKTTPEGVISSDEFGTIRITRIDADIADMLMPFQKSPW